MILYNNIISLFVINFSSLTVQNVLRKMGRHDFNE